MQACAPGEMLAIQASEREVVALLSDHPAIAIAAVNGPTSVVVSGHSVELEPIRNHCAAQGIRATSLSVSHAFHSSLMDPALPEFEAIAAGLTMASPTVPILSNLTGQSATSEQLTSARYGPDTCASRSDFLTVLPGCWGRVNTSSWSSRARSWLSRSATR